MKLSRERIVHISHLVLDYLNEDDRVEFFADPQEIRQDVFKMISDEIRADEMVDGLVRRKLESQRRVVEGSEEWDILYRKYHEEEISRHRKVLP